MASFGVVRNGYGFEVVKFDHEPVDTVASIPVSEYIEAGNPDIESFIVAKVQSPGFRGPKPHQIIRALLQLLTEGHTYSESKVQAMLHIASFPLPDQFNSEFQQQLIDEYVAGGCGSLIRSDQWLPTRTVPFKTILGLDPKARHQSLGYHWGFNNDLNPYSAWGKANLYTKAQIEECARYGQVPVQKSTAAFPMFANFAKEIQDLIWTYAVEYEQNIVVLEWRFKEAMDGCVTENRFVDVNGPPKLLSVCHAAREIALKRYTKAFGTWMSKPMVYVDFKKDIIFIKTGNYYQLPNLVSYLLDEEIQQIQHLALPYRDFIKSNRRHWGLIANPLMRSEKIKSLRLVCGDGRQDVHLCYATLTRKRNRDMWKIVETYLTAKWAKLHPSVEAPQINMKVVDAIQAHKWAIDEMIW